MSSHYYLARSFINGALVKGNASDLLSVNNAARDPVIPFLPLEPPAGGVATGSSRAVGTNASVANKITSASAVTQAIVKDHSAAQKVVAATFTGDFLSVARSQSATAKRGAGVASQLAIVKDATLASKRGSATVTTQTVAKDQSVANKRASATAVGQTVAVEQSTALKVVAGTFTGDFSSVARSQSATAKRGTGVGSQYLHVLHVAISASALPVAVPDWSRYIFEITRQEYSLEICAQCYELALPDKTMAVEFYL